jgi:hypothetical protein
MKLHGCEIWDLNICSLLKWEREFIRPFILNRVDNKSDKKSAAVQLANKRRRGNSLVGG